MLVAWRYRKRDSLVQSFDPRAWLIFIACYLVSTLFFWDLRYLMGLASIAALAVITSRIGWKPAWCRSTRTWWCRPTSPTAG